MASGVNVKMGVTGISQFKQNIQQAKTSLKTLDEQLKLNEKEFKANGDAQTYMETKAKLLQEKMAEQKTVIQNAQKALDDMAKSGVDKASKAYQDMQRQLIQAKGELLDTQGAMDGITEAGDDASDSVSEMNSQLSNIGKNVAWDNVTEGLEKITSGMENVIKKAWQVGKSIVDATLGAGAWADELQTTADQYEITPEQLYRMRQVADQIDTDAETILDAQDRLAKNNSKKSEDFMGALAFLKIDPTGKKNLDLFWEAGEAIMALGENEDKAYYAQQIFGKSWRELLPLFKAGREEYNKKFGEASWVGDENFQSLTALDDESQKLNNSWETLQQTFLGTLAGPMKDVFELLNGVLEEFNEYLQSDEGKEALKQMGETITALIRDLVNINPEDVANGLKTVIEKITEAFKWIEEHQEDIKTALKVIGGAFVAMKLGTVASNIARIVSGFKTLWGGANNPLPKMTGGGGGGALTGLGAGGAGGGGGIIGSLKGLVASNGLSLLTPAAVIAAAVIPAELARKEDEKRWAEQRERWSSASEKLSAGNGKEFTEAAARSLNDPYRPNGDAYNYLMGLQNRSDLQMSQLHNMVGSDTWTALQEFWRTGGENMADFQVTQLFQDVADSYSKMVETSQDVTGAAEEQTKATKEMTDAAKEMQKLPGEIAQSLSGVTVFMDGQAVGEVMLPYINNGMGSMINP